MPCHAMTARPQILFLLAIIAIFAGCNKSYDEKIGGVEIPIPREMKKSDGARVEVALLGLVAVKVHFAVSWNPRR